MNTILKSIFKIFKQKNVAFLFTIKHPLIRRTIDFFFVHSGKKTQLNTSTSMYYYDTLNHKNKTKSSKIMKRLYDQNYEAT